MGYKIRPCSVVFTRDLSSTYNTPVVLYEVYEEGIQPSIGGMSMSSKPDRIIVKDIAKEQAKTILREILSEG